VKESELSKLGEKAFKQEMENKLKIVMSVMAIAKTIDF